MKFLPIVNIQKNPTQIAECTEAAAMSSKGYISAENQGNITL